MFKFSLNPKGGTVRARVPAVEAPKIDNTCLPKATPTPPSTQKSMKNFMVFVRGQNNQTSHHYKFTNEKGHDFVSRNIRAQIDNSIRLGWNPKDCILVTNFAFSYRGVTAIPITGLYEKCSFVNKWLALQQIWKDGITNADVWYHDLDAWQLSRMEFPQKVDTIGFYKYPFGMQGGSVFIRFSGKWIIDKYVRLAKRRHVKNDEHLWNELYSGECRKDITLIDTTYNVGRCKWFERYTAAEKPIKVIHYKPEESWIRHGDVSVNKFITPPALENILREHHLWHPDNDL